jgi:hypothetical protein
VLALVKGLSQPDSTFFLYDYQKNKLTAFTIPGEGKDLEAGPAYFDADENLVFLATRIPGGAYGKGYEKGNTDVARYNPVTKSLEWLTTDGCPKKDLKVYHLR